MDGLVTALQKYDEFEIRLLCGYAFVRYILEALLRFYGGHGILKNKQRPVEKFNTGTVHVANDAKQN